MPTRDIVNTTLVFVLFMPHIQNITTLRELSKKNFYNKLLHVKTIEFI